eukprot:NODE_126_length_17250_cov_2.558743.p13 type:complete len:161 gc:universal NODE_126_length_17250_cov_2.558743:10416-10898(+)
MFGCHWANCKKICHTDLALYHHVIYFHVPQFERYSILRCDWKKCYCYFKTRAELISHIKCHLRRPTFRCVECGKWFNSKNEFSRHKAFHGHLRTENYTEAPIQLPFQPVKAVVMEWPVSETLPTTKNDVLLYPKIPEFENTLSKLRLTLNIYIRRAVITK